MGAEPAEELSGEVTGEEVSDGTVSESSPEDRDDKLALRGWISGALYESIFVVETSSTGADILCLIVPAGNCFVVILRLGRGADISDIFVRFVVKARARDIVADDSFDFQKIYLTWCGHRISLTVR